MFLLGCSVALLLVSQGRTSPDATRANNEDGDEDGNPQFSVQWLRNPKSRIPETWCVGQGCVKGLSRLQRL